MSRRKFLRQCGGLIGGALLAGCAGGARGAGGAGGAGGTRNPPVGASSGAGGAGPAAAGDGELRAVAFDLFTLFDPRSVLPVAEALFPGAGQAFVDAWRTRQFQYSWLRATAGQYRDFRQVTADAAIYAARTRQRRLTAAELAQLVDANEQLQPWPDTADVLRALRQRGLRLVTLANFTLGMQRVLLGRVGLVDHFERLISSDELRAYKPEPRAYQLACDHLRLPRQHIAFSAFGAWDAAGAAWFGYPTFWVNRLGVPEEELGGDLTHEIAAGADLVALQQWISARSNVAVPR